MKLDTLDFANDICEKIKTLEEEIRELSYKEHVRRNNIIGERFLRLRKLLGKPTKKTYKHYWCSHDLDSIGSIILFDADEIKVLIDFKKSKLEKLKMELETL